MSAIPLPYIFFKGGKKAHSSIIKPIVNLLIINGWMIQLVTILYASLEFSFDIKKMSNPARQLANITLKFRSTKHRIVSKNQSHPIELYIQSKSKLNRQVISH